LLCLGQPQEALAALHYSLDHRLPGKIIDLTTYNLLAAAPHPPEGITEMIELLNSALKQV
jgi:hypothetical protein